MAHINGDWFHSRSSSNIGELLTVRKIVLESQKTDYIGLGWSGGRLNNEKLFRLSHTVGIEPSTMQTKIRTMIRYGFIRDENHCPIQFLTSKQMYYITSNYFYFTKLNNYISILKIR